MSDMTPTPQTTLGILLGASEWPNSKLSGSPAFARSAHKIKEYFLYSGHFGFRPENWLDLFDRNQSSPYEVDQRIGNFLQERISLLKETGTPARDLLFYYIGHGLFAFGSDQASYHLAIRSTREESLRTSAIPMAALAETLKTNARQLRRFVILDCCFAAESFKYMLSAPDQAALQQTISAFEEKSTGKGFPKKGTALLCSSGHKEASLLLPDESGTMFSEALIRALSEGGVHQQEKTYLSLYDLKTVVEEVLESLAKGNAPRPFVSSPDQSDGDVALIPFFPNPWNREGLLHKARQAEQVRQAEQARQAEQVRQAEQARQAEALDYPTASPKTFRTIRRGRVFSLITNSILLLNLWGIFAILGISHYDWWVILGAIVLLSFALFFLPRLYARLFSSLLSIPIIIGWGIAGWFLGPLGSKRIPIPPIYLSIAFVIVGLLLSFVEVSVLVVLLRRRTYGV